MFFADSSDEEMQYRQSIRSQWMQEFPDETGIRGRTEHIRMFKNSEIETDHFIKSVAYQVDLRKEIYDLREHYARN